MTKKQYGDYQFDIYFDGLEGRTPNYPVDYAALERAAAEVLPPWVLSYVAGGAGDESTQRGSVEAFSRYGIMPRMLVGATERDLSVSLFDMRLPTPLFMCPIGVIGLCSQDFHGDIAVAKATSFRRRGSSSPAPLLIGMIAVARRERHHQREDEQEEHHADDDEIRLRDLNDAPVDVSTGALRNDA
jgi:hypothetical protein